MKATEQLRKEHKAVKVMLLILDKISGKLESGEEIDYDHLDKTVEFFKVFVDKCHHTKEENLLFSAMQRTSDPSDGDRIGALLKDHASGRNYIHDLTAAIDDYRKGNSDARNRIISNARHYITLLIQHIDIEDNVLYPIADKRLSVEKQDELLIQFDKIEEDEIGVGKHEEYHRLIDELRAVYL